MVAAASNEDDDIATLRPLSLHLWLTLRERHDLNHYRPAFTEPERPDKSPTVVHTPSGQRYDVADPQLATELWPTGARAIRQDRGIFDTFPISIITTQTIARLSEMVGAPLDVQRFRPNILVEASGDAPFAEDEWVGSVLRIGELRVRVDKRDGRCMVITVDPVTGEKNPAVLLTVAAKRKGCLGVYGTTIQVGRMELGASVLSQRQP